jgi:hypothetical protein
MRFGTNILVRRVNKMAIGEIFSSSIGFLEVVTIILLIREVIRLIGGGATGKDVTSAVKSGWSDIKDRWDRRIEGRDAKRKAEVELGEKIGSLTLEGENDLAKLANGATAIKNAATTPDTFLKMLPQVEKDLVDPMRASNEDLRIKVFGEDRKIIVADEKLIQDDMKNDDDLLTTISDEVKKQKAVGATAGATKTEKAKATRMVNLLNTLSAEVKAVKSEKAVVLKTISDTMKSVDVLLKKDDDVVFVLNDFKVQLSNLNNVLKGNKTDTLRKRGECIGRIKAGSDKLLVLVRDIKMHYDNEIVLAVKNYRFEMDKIKASNERILKLTTATTVTAKTPATP